MGIITAGDEYIRPRKPALEQFGGGLALLRRIANEQRRVRLLMDRLDHIPSLSKSVAAIGYIYAESVRNKPPGAQNGCVTA